MTERTNYSDDYCTWPVTVMQMYLHARDMARVIHRAVGREWDNNDDDVLAALIASAMNQGPGGYAGTGYIAVRYEEEEIEGDGAAPLRVSFEIADCLLPIGGET